MNYRVEFAIIHDLIYQNSKFKIQNSKFKIYEYLLGYLISMASIAQAPMQNG